MKESEFNVVTAAVLSQTLGPLGFSNQGSRHCTFFRKASEEVYHFISPVLLTDGARYYLQVFPHSPHLEPLFQEWFPDELGIPTDSWSCLSEHDGVGLTQEQFTCKNEAVLRSSLMGRVGGLLLNLAVPYLDRFQTVADLVHVIRHPSFLGLALYYVGRTAEAVEVLRVERERLRGLDTSDRRVGVLLAHVESLLAEDR